MYSKYWSVASVDFYSCIVGALDPPTMPTKKYLCGHCDCNLPLEKYWTHKKQYYKDGNWVRECDEVLKRCRVEEPGSANEVDGSNWTCTQVSTDTDGIGK